MKEMTLECPEAGWVSGKHTLESKGSSTEEKGASRNIRGTQKHGCGSSVSYARTGLVSENCTRYTRQGPIRRRHKLYIPKSQQSCKMCHLGVWCAPSCPQRPGLGHWGTSTNPSQQAWENYQGGGKKTNKNPPGGGILCDTRGNGRDGQHANGMVCGRSNGIVNDYGLTNIGGSDSQTTSHQWAGKKSHLLGPENQPKIVR